MLHCKPAKSIINNSRSDWFSKANKLVWAEPCARWAELKMLSFWAGGISSFSPCARKYRLLRRLRGTGRREPGRIGAGGGREAGGDRAGCGSYVKAGEE